MDNGQFGALGPYAAKLVEEERRPDAEDVILHHQLEVAKVVLETRHNHKDATQNSALDVRLKEFYTKNWFIRFLTVRYIFYFVIILSLCRHISQKLPMQKEMALFKIESEVQ